MGKQYAAFSEHTIKFISEQKLFFVGIATEDSRVNVSPKGMDTFRVLNINRVIWLNVTGSGNETSAHIQKNSRMTVMFCAFEGPPLILRPYGQATVIHKNDPDWAELYAHFNPLPGARQIFDLAIDLAQTSCGMAVPYYAYTGDGELLTDWVPRRVMTAWSNTGKKKTKQVSTNTFGGNSMPVSDGINSSNLVIMSIFIVCSLRILDNPT